MFFSFLLCRLNSLFGSLFIYISLIVFIATSAFANDVKRYTIKSGEIHYKIQESGEVMGFKTSSQGERSFYFRNYGSQIMEEKKLKETSNGMGENETKQIHTMDKRDKDKIYSVDFNNKQIVVMQDPSLSMYKVENIDKESEKIMQQFGGKKIGSDKVLGYKCTIWEVMGSRQCMYKNQIPLWIETNIMGVKNRETAVSVKFNKRIRDKRFNLPDFPIKNVQGAAGGGFATIPTAGMSPKEAMQMQEIIKDVQQAIEPAMAENSNMDPKALEEKAIKALSESDYINNQLKKTKRNLPIALDLSKRLRKCLKKADDIKEANACYGKMEKKVQKFGLQDLLEEDDFRVSSWSAQDKEKALADLDEGIGQMDKLLPCLKKAQSFLELMNCPGFSE